MTWLCNWKAFLFVPNFILFVGFSLHSSVFAEVLLPVGCPKAHCSQDNRDWAYVPAPSQNSKIVWHRNLLPGEKAGSGIGLGCSGNGHIAVCTFQNIRSHSNVIAYDYDGARLWDSRNLLGPEVVASAPMILANGDVIIADSKKVIRFSGDGSVAWSTPLPFGGTTLSPVLTDDRVLILATKSGPVYALDSITGQMLAHHFILQSPADAGYFETQNTPAIKGNRVFIITQHQIGGSLDPNKIGWLVAIDVDRDAPNEEDRLKVAWHFEVGTESRSSPIVTGDVVLFESSRANAGTDDEDPHVFAVTNGATEATEIWRKRLTSPAFASFLLDPRPETSFWHFALASPTWTRRSVETGDIIETINFSNIMGLSGYTFATSAMTLVGNPSAPIVYMGVSRPPLFSAPGTSGAYLLAIDLNNRQLHSKTLISAENTELLHGQFPLVSDGEKPRVIFSTKTSGVWAVGEPSP